MNFKYILLWLFLLSLGVGCSTPPRQPTSQPSNPPPLTEIVPTKLPPSHTGNPSSYEVFGECYFVDNTSKGYRQRGLASWYGPKFHGKKTSSGVPFDMNAMTAAHKTLPLPTFVRVTHLGNGRSIIVKVNDRGPFIHKRIIDLSRAAATQLDMIKTGTAPVEVVALEPYQHLADFTHSGTECAVTPNRQVSTASSRAQQMAKLKAPFYLQVGAFSQRQNAEQLQTRLARRFQHPIRIDSTAGELHKVRVGPFEDPAELRRLATQLDDLGVLTPHVVYD